MADDFLPLKSLRGTAAWESSHSLALMILNGARADFDTDIAVLTPHSPLRKNQNRRKRRKFVIHET